MPSVLLDGVAPRQYTPWPLHREVERVKQLAHMPGMVGDAELLLDHPGNHGRGPHAVVQSVSHRPTIQNVPSCWRCSGTNSGGLPDRYPSNRPSTPWT